MDLPTAVAFLTSIKVGPPDDAFGEKVSELECALNCLLTNVEMPAAAKGSLQFFLSRLENNRATFATHKPAVHAYRRLQAEMEVCSATVISLLGEIDAHEAESTRLATEESDLKARLLNISSRQGEIVTALCPGSSDCDPARKHEPHSSF